MHGLHHVFEQSFVLRVRVRVRVRVKVRVRVRVRVRLGTKKMDPFINVTTTPNP